MRFWLYPFPEFVVLGLVSHQLPELEVLDSILVDCTFSSL